jgi:transposase InsO family protein
MCAFLGISRSTYYYEAKAIKVDTELENDIIKIFKSSRNNYGTRKIKKVLENKGKIVSRRRIGRIMAKYGLVSNYTVAQYKVHQSTCNNDVVKNEVNREFNNREESQVIVSDLTYVRVAERWHYVCLLIDLYNREIIGYSSGPNKDAPLVHRAFSSIKRNLYSIEYFHTDRGNEFKNKLIDETLETFKIKRSLSNKGCPYDNAVAEATFKLFKIEFSNHQTFESLEQFNLELADYINWFNYHRIHGSLDYMSPVEFRKHHSL